MKQSLQMIADLRGCRSGQHYLKNAAQLKQLIDAVIGKIKVTALASRFHTFKKGGGISAIYILSESHLAFHTWPEDQSVNVDMFLCNYARQNEQKAQNLVKYLQKVFTPRRISKRAIRRYY